MANPFVVSRSLAPEHRRMLGLLGVASFFEGYDLNVLLVALPQIRETFDLSKASASRWLIALFLGALPAIFVARFADRIGRRRVLVVTIAGYLVATGATAAAPTMAVFVMCQFVSRLFLSAENSVVWTVIAEELPPESRGYGFGWLALMSATGTGLCALLYGSVFSAFDWSWRGLYLVGLAPVALLAYARRSLPESRQYEQARDTEVLATSWRAILAPERRRLLLLVCTTSVLGALASQAGVFIVDFMESVRGLSQTEATNVLVIAGALALPVLMRAGGASDRWGRKRVGCTFAIGGAIASVAGFYLARGPLWLAVSLTFSLAGSFGSWPTLGGMVTELFPTSVRAQATAWTGASRVVGQALSFWFASLILGASSDNQPLTAAILTLGPVLAVLIVARFVPETKGITLTHT